jgi:hypothetical protein
VLAAQSPRAANPERPTVATHAYPVAPGFVELEQGLRLLYDGADTELFAWDFNLKAGLRRDVQIAFFGTGFGSTDFGSGLGDVGGSVKWAFPGRRHAFALVPALTVPTGDATAGLSAGRALGSFTGVYSVDLPGELHFDANVGPAGIGAGKPQWFTSVGLARGFPRVALAVELYDFTSGAAGGAQRGFLYSVLLTFAEWAVVDFGGVWGLRGGTDDQVFVGLTTNFGRLFD